MRLLEKLKAFFNNGTKKCEMLTIKSYAFWIECNREQLPGVEIKTIVSDPQEYQCLIIFRKNKFYAEFFFEFYSRR